MVDEYRPLSSIVCLVVSSISTQNNELSVNALPAFFEADGYPLSQVVRLMHPHFRPRIACHWILYRGKQTWIQRWIYLVRRPQHMAPIEEAVADGGRPGVRHLITKRNVELRNQGKFPSIKTAGICPLCQKATRSCRGCPCLSRRRLSIDVEFLLRASDSQANRTVNTPASPLSRTKQTKIVSQELIFCAERIIIIPALPLCIRTCQKDIGTERFAQRNNPRTDLKPHGKTSWNSSRTIPGAAVVRITYFPEDPAIMHGSGVQI